MRVRGYVSMCASACERALCVRMHECVRVCVPSARARILLRKNNNYDKRKLPKAHA